MNVITKVMLPPIVALALVGFLGFILGGFNPFWAILGFLIFWGALSDNIKELLDAEKKEPRKKKNSDSNFDEND